MLSAIECLSAVSCKRETDWTHDRHLYAGNSVSGDVTYIFFVNTHHVCQCMVLVGSAPTFVYVYANRFNCMKINVRLWLCSVCEQNEKSDNAANTFLMLLSV